MMIVAAARELAGQRVCFVGVGLPNIAVNLAQRTVAPELELVYESGVFGARPARLPLSIGDPTIVTGRHWPSTSMLELFGYYLQRGLVDVGFLGAAQIDRFGNINTTVIGDYAHPRTRLPGSGGACEIAINARHGVRDHAPVEAVVRGAHRLPDLARQPRRRRGRRADPPGTGLDGQRAHRSWSRTWASTTSTRTARCASIRSIPGATLDAGARRDGAGRCAWRPTWRPRPAPSRRGAAAHPRGARPGGPLHRLGGAEARALGTKAGRLPRPGGCSGAARQAVPDDQVDAHADHRQRHEDGHDQVRAAHRRRRPGR